jgi:FKBP-type peptidyl-prolyl cis-trans isomerase/protein-disulfide isomerase
VQADQHGAQLFGRHLEQTIATKLEHRGELVGDARVVASRGDTPGVGGLGDIEAEIDIEEQWLGALALVLEHADDAVDAQLVDEDAIAGHWVGEGSSGSDLDEQIRVRQPRRGSAMQIIVPIWLVPALSVLTLSSSLACTPPGATSVAAPPTTNEATPADPLAAEIDDHFRPERFFVPYSSADPSRGAQDNALVTIVVFTDYRHGIESIEGYLDHLLEAHGDELLVVIKPIATNIDDGRDRAALAVWAAAEQGHGWAMHELLVHANGPITEQQARTYAAQIKLPDLARFDAVLASDPNVALKSNIELSQRLGVNDYPFFFVNGAPYTDVVSLADLSGIHTAEHELAVGLIRAGTRPQDLYSAFTNGAPFEREPAIIYRHPFEGRPRSSTTLANGVVIDEFVVGEGEPVRENTVASFNFRGYTTIYLRQDMGSRENPSNLVINDVTRKNGNPIDRVMIEALEGMKPGGKRRVWIPAALVESVGLPVGDLILTVEVVSVDPASSLSGIEAFAGPPISTRTLPNGLEISDYAAGVGTPAQQGDRVGLHYILRLADGTQLDDSHERGDPLVMTIGGGEVIEGVAIGIEGVKIGMLRKLVIPPELGYGEQNIDPIPPNSTLTFYLEIMSVSSPIEVQGE